MKTETREKTGQSRKRWLSPARVRATILLGTAAVVAVSCMTLNRLAMAPPSIPGAEFLGSESCAECHDSYNRDFHTASHAALMAPGENAIEAGCESCHGPGSIHVESGGAFHTIVNPGKSPQVCFDCHLDIRARFGLPHHHDIANGRVNCSECHESHKGPAIREGAALMAGSDDGCVRCHAAQRGPFAFEHEAMREGCTVCHDPHGSLNAKMLTERSSNLCLKCHVQERNSDLMIGGLSHSFLAQRGTCWTAGCHEAVHGSHVSTSLRF